MSQHDSRTCRCPGCRHWRQERQQERSSRFAKPSATKEERRDRRFAIACEVARRTPLTVDEASHVVSALRTLGLEISDRSAVAFAYSSIRSESLNGLARELRDRMGAWLYYNP